MCGKPGYTPLNNYEPKKEEYCYGEIVTYTCSNKSAICYPKDPVQRQCINGFWTGKVPVYYMALDIEDLHPKNKPNEYFIMDRNFTHYCIDLYLARSASWEVQLLKPVIINVVQVVFDSPINVSVTIYVQQGKKVEQIFGNTSNTVSGKKTRTFFNSSRLMGDKVGIRLYEIPGFRVEKVKLCAVYLYTQPDKGCLVPDMPLKAFGRKSSSVYYFSCPEGYQLMGKAHVVCQQDGTYEHHTTTCQKITHCGELPTVPQGRWQFNSTAVNSTAWLECREGYTPLGHDSAYCLPTGFWTPSGHRCKAIECDGKPHIPHGKGILLSGSTFYGSKLQIMCDRGYSSVDPEPRECLRNSTWGNLNICAEINCGPLKTEVSRNGKWVSLNETVLIKVLICEEGYHIERSPAVTQCLSNGSWSVTTASCKRTPRAEAWNSEWSSNTILWIAAAVGAATAILVLCLAMCGFMVKKRRRQYSESNAAIFHVNSKDSPMYDDVKEQQCYKTNMYEDVIELRENPASTIPRKPSSALPHLPMDADPVYAQPFEATPNRLKMAATGAPGDLYTAHIYAEPVDSKRPPSDPIEVQNSIAETWLRNGAKKLGRKMSLPGRSITQISEDFVQQSAQNHNETCKPLSNSSKLNSTNFPIEEKNIFEPKRQETLAGLINNAIYLDIKDKNYCGSDLEQLQMIDNDIYQDDYFSNA